MQTTTSILRTRIAKLGDKEFTIEDVTYPDLEIKDHNAFVIAASYSLTRLSYSYDREIEIVRKQKKPTGGYQNVYKVVKLKVIAAKVKRDKIEKDKPVNIWSIVYPEFFNNPYKSLRKKPVVYSKGY
jgi:hypothetical protein